MYKFHRRCGDRVTLLNQSLTAIRNFVEFNHGLILGADPLIDDVVFEVRIDRKVNVWNGSLEIGVTTLDPEYMELPATATKLRNTAWILSGNSIVKDGVTLINVYGPELDSLREGDCVGVTRSSKGELLFSVNGRCLGVAATDMPPRLFAVIDLYGQCVQVSIMQSNSHICTRLPIDSMDEIEEYLEDDEDRQQGEAAAWSEPRASRNTHVQIPIVCPLVSQDHLRFHPRCGILVKLSSNNKTAERARPLDDYNNGVVMTHRPLYDNELFEIRIDRLIDKWSGSIEVGVTSHNPATIRFPSTMTNMESGTIMMSGSKVLLNGHGTSMEYGNFNLDELREGDTVGMMRKGNGKLHYFINGIDQGVASNEVAAQVWGVIDLYGMTVRVTIVDPCEDLDSNTHHRPIRAYSTPQVPSSYRPAIDEESLLFHTVRDSNVIIINDGKTAHRPNAFEIFNNGIVMTNRTLKTNELFQVRLDLVIPKWAGSIEIGVTQHSSKDIKFPFRMSSEKSGTWAVMGEDVMRDGIVIIPQYMRNLNKLVEGDTVGVMRKDMGILHFYINGIDQGPAAFNIPEHVFGIVDLYGRVAQGTIVDMYVPPYSSTPESPMSSESNTTVFPEMCFHRVYGENARLSRHRLTASRATVYSEFNDAILFSSRPLRECDMFEIRIEKMVDCWIGSLEIGVTAIRPDDLEANGGVGAIAGTATDLTWDTYILSGAAMMKDGECVRSGYPLDLDLLTVGSRVGIMWHADRSLHYYLDGMDMGKAWYVPHLNIYAVVDLYGQCTQVSIVQTGDRNYNYNGCNGEHFVRRRGHIAPQPPYWSFSEYYGHNIVMRKEFSIAHRKTLEYQGAMVFSTSHLAIDDIFEIQIVESKYIFAGSFRMGVTDINILNANVNRNLPYNIPSLPHFTAYIDGQYMKYSKPASRKPEVRAFTPSFDWLRPGDRVGFKKTADSRVLIYYNSELLDMAIEKVPDKVYVVCELGGHVYMIKTVPRGAPIVLPSQQTIKNDSETMEQPQRQSISLANATDNATGQNMDSSDNINEDTGLPLSPSDLLGLGDWFEFVERCYFNERFPPSAPTIASLERSTSPQQPDDDELIVSDDDEPIAADYDEPIAADNDESITADNDELFIADNDELILSDSDESIAADNDELIAADNNESIAADNDEYMGVDNDDYIAADKDEPIAADKDEPTAADKDEPIAANNDEIISADKVEHIIADNSEPIAADNDNPIAADNDDLVAFNNDVLIVPNGDEPFAAVGDEPVSFNGNEPNATNNEEAANSGSKHEIEVEGAAAAAPTEDGAVAGPSDGGSTAIPVPKKRRRPLPYTFHDLHGKNIRLRSSDTVAVRYQGYAEGVAISSQSLRRGNHFRFRVDKVTPDWIGTVCIGAVATLPNDSLPRSALHFDKPAWFLTSDVVMNRGRYRTTDMGMPLEDITENSVLTLHFKFNSELTLDVDGVLCGAIAVIPRMFTHIYPAIDLYGRVTQISILLHPHVIHGGHSLDLPVIDENLREESQGTPDDEDYGGDEDDDDEMDSSDDATGGLRPNPSLQQLAEWRNTKKNRDPETDALDEPLNYQTPGPSKRPDFLPGLPNANDAKNHQIKFKQTLPEQNSLHHSLMRNTAFEISALETFALVRRSLSTEQFKVGFVEIDDSEDEEEEEEEEEEEDDEDDDDDEVSGNSPFNALSLGSRMGDDDDSLDVPEICDTNIRHNDRYPEASDVDLLDNEIVDALTLDAGNLPDLTEEQSPSIDDSTRRDEIWSDGIMHIENLTYLNNIINYNPDEAGPRFAERDWVFYSETNGNCEHMHLALKYWNYLVLPYPDMREVVASGQVRCFCPNCQPDAEQQFAGWVRIERANAGGSNHMFWHLLRSTLVSASAMSGEASGGGGARRPRVLCTAPSTNPTAADIWFDEEGKPHHTVIALDIDLSANMDPANDRLLAYMIYLRSHITLNEDSADPLSFED